LSEGQTADVLANLVAHELDVCTWDDDQVLHPVVVALARHYQIAIPPILQGEQTDIEDEVNARAAAAEEDPASVGARVRKILRQQLVMDPDDVAVPEDQETFGGDLNMAPEDAADFGQRLADEFGFERPPFVIDPDGDTNLPDIGFDTVGSLITFLEKRLAHQAKAAE
jgi:acyl carrier protein